MCLGIPYRILSVDGISALASDDRETRLIDISLVEPVVPGDWVLCFLDAARSVIDAHEAGRIRDALDGLAAVMAGGDAADAFADLEARGPILPPHLQAALDAGQIQG
ncbi:HypC/HybG/HupF family hydrogenase formation chaperone [Tabrizicola sp. J26]|uniref:HypC/HybG/HupF family hydrogenase formation chaperone n=1 Tax=Alitabrizicola rongguiensis TaxID=2909234 RepID=UPI001F3244E9|nr:HypC/HybG/HupF family hydrogenase formation chaperone [Tabrizicola rongguiensis]MCF1709326.1 HypC/HybG/HupF family hydrogenase formation chaperone [Tabrizicola rongguiensis]